MDYKAWHYDVSPDAPPLYVEKSACCLVVYIIGFVEPPRGKGVFEMRAIGEASPQIPV